MCFRFCCYPCYCKTLLCLNQWVWLCVLPFASKRFVIIVLFMLSLKIWICMIRTDCEIRDTCVGCFLLWILGCNTIGLLCYSVYCVYLISSRSCIGSVICLYMQTFFNMLNRERVLCEAWCCRSLSATNTAFMLYTFFFLFLIYFSIQRFQFLVVLFVIYLSVWCFWSANQGSLFLDGPATYSNQVLGFSPAISTIGFPVFIGISLQFWQVRILLLTGPIKMHWRISQSPNSCRLIRVLNP